jgi:hypothetical protein
MINVRVQPFIASRVSNLDIYNCCEFSLDLFLLNFNGNKKNEERERDQRNVSEAINFP